MTHELDFNLDFKGKTALVVGGSSGIGNGIAQAIAQAGAITHVWGSRPSAADYANEPGSNLENLIYTQVDGTDADSLTREAGQFTTLDILILCQGTVQYDRAEFAPAGWNRVLDVNLNSVMWTATAFQPLLSQSRGAVVIVSSIAGFRATRGNPAYAASKAGAVALTKTLAAAWAGQGIRVNGIAPGLVDTKLTRVTTANPKRLAASLAAIPAGRLGTPADMAGPALFLCSPLANYLVGQTLIVDGGLTLT